jgi:hypothetical protein
VRTLALARLGPEGAPCAEGKDPISTFKATTTLTEKARFQTKSTKAGNTGEIPNIIPSMMAGAISSHRLCGPPRLRRPILRRLSRTTEPGKRAFHLELHQLLRHWPHHRGRHHGYLVLTVDQKTTSLVEHRCPLSRLYNPNPSLHRERIASLKI